MRLAFELSFSTAYLFERKQPVFVCMDDITFLKPVEIGSMLSLDATVVYTQDGYAIVETIASVINPHIGQKEVTNTFVFTFYYPQEYSNQPSDRVLKKVIPHTYEEAMRYLSGRRTFFSREQTFHKTYSSSFNA